MKHRISILTTNGLFSAKEDKLDVIGVVLQTEVVGMIISLDQWKEVWSHERSMIVNKKYSGASVLQTFEGIGLTRNIVRQNKKDNEEMTAALRCWDYKKGGLQWHLPSLYELSTIVAYRDELNEVFASLESEPLNKNSFIWSSSEFDSIFAYCLVVNTGAFNIGEKAMSSWVRAVSTYSPLRTK